MKFTIRLCVAAILCATAVCAAGLANNEGIVVKPGTGAGKITFINTQTRLAATNILQVMSIIDPQREYNLTYQETAYLAPEKLKANAKADLAIIVIDAKDQPTTLVAVDDGWAVVNVATLDRSLKSERAKQKFFAGRCRRQLLRVYALAAGGASSMYHGNLFDSVKLEKLDFYKEAIPFDVVVKTENYLSAIGVTKRVYKSYSEACEEGWAPSPTNAIQKAIWDKIHALPDKPIKIKYDPNAKR